MSKYYEMWQRTVFQTQSEILFLNSCVKTPVFASTPTEAYAYLNVTIGDIYIYNYCNEDHIAEVISVDKSSGMSYIKLMAGTYRGTNMWVRPDLLEEITGDRQETANECQCGAKHTSNPKFHLNYCPLVGRYK